MISISLGGLRTFNESIERVCANGDFKSFAFTLGHVLNCRNVFLWRNGRDERRVREVKECENEASVCATVPARLPCG